MVREKCPEALEAGVDALHPPPLVGVGDLPPDSSLLVHALACATDDGAKAALADAQAAVADAIDPEKRANS